MIDPSTLPGGTALNRAGKTLTHELGHYLGLRHTFNNYTCSETDYVDDTNTEKHLHRASSKCPAHRPQSCSSPDPIHNYMDYTADTCRCTFTPGQMDRLWGARGLDHDQRRGLLDASVPTEPLELYEQNGCCRFTGWKAVSWGKLTPAECQHRCEMDGACIAADVARPQGGVYDCYTFLGSGINFHTECDTNSPFEQCYYKPQLLEKNKKQAKTFHFEGYGCCRYDDWHAESWGYQSTEDCIQLCSWDKDCIAADVARPNRQGLFDCYTFYGAGQNFHVGCGGTDLAAKCFKKQ